MKSRILLAWVMALLMAVSVAGCQGKEKSKEKPEIKQEIPAEEYEQAPQVVKSVVPEYPEDAQKAGIEGQVFLHVLIGKNGKVEEVRFIKGPSVFKEVALAAAKQFEFTPAMHNDKPVRVWMSLPLTFTLKD